MQDIVLGRLNADLWPATSVGTQHFVFPVRQRIPHASWCFGQIVICNWYSCATKMPREKISNLFSIQWYKKISEKKLCHCTYLHALVTIFFCCLCSLCWSRFYKVLGALSRHEYSPSRKQICQLLDFPGLAHKLHQQVKQNCRTTFFSVKLQFSCRDLGCL